MSTKLEILPTMKCEIEKLDASICVREWQKKPVSSECESKACGHNSNHCSMVVVDDPVFLWASYSIQSPTEIESNTLDHCSASTSLHNVWSATEWSAFEPNVIDAKSIRSF